MTHPYERSFAEAWADPRHTRIDPPDLDVNAVLAERYELSEPLTFTRTHLWDMEVRKAWRPDLYVPVVDPASVRAWGSDPDFTRVSKQLLWKDPGTYGVVIERVHLDHDEQKVTFLGTARAVDDRGETLTAGTGQPLFHVEHGASGWEEQPLNTWRLVSLTEAPDEELAAAFAPHLGPWLPVFVEYYIEKVLGVGIRRKG